MNIDIKYFIIIILANTLGAISGMGGGIIIKPSMDFLHQDSLQNIGLYSSAAVLTMSVVSIYIQSKSDVKINKTRSVFLAIGSIVGGFMGSQVLHTMLKVLHSSTTVSMIQISSLILILLVILANNFSKHPNFNFKTNGLFLFSGLILGFISSFLSIGGGPMNTALILLLFNLPIKSANIYSLIIIFCSQATNIGTIALTTGFSNYKTSTLIYIIPAALIGGILGSQLAKKMNETMIHKIFVFMIILTIMINVYNLTQLI